MTENTNFVKREEDYANGYTKMLGNVQTSCVLLIEALEARSVEL